MLGGGAAWTELQSEVLQLPLSLPPLNSYVGLLRALKFPSLCFLICEMGIIIVLLVSCQIKEANPCMPYFFNQTSTLINSEINVGEDT